MLVITSYSIHYTKLYDECRLPCAVLNEATPAMAGRLVRGVLQAVRGDLRRLNAGHIHSVLELAEGARSQAELHLPGAWVGRRYQVLWIRQKPPVVRPVVPQEIAGPGSYPLGVV